MKRLLIIFLVLISVAQAGEIEVKVGDKLTVRSKNTYSVYYIQVITQNRDQYIVYSMSENAQYYMSAVFLKYHLVKVERRSETVYLAAK